MLKYLLDTNICIYVINRRPPALRSIFNEQTGHMAISTVTLSELVYGAEKSAQVNQNLAVVESFAARLEVLPYGQEAAWHFGQIRSELERSGKTIGAYDLMIAAHARSEGLVLVTNNLREFKRVQGLRLENWV